MKQLTNFEKKNRECLPVAKLKNLKLGFQVKISQFSALCIIDWACDLVH